jgi:hypothetical protein
MPHSPAFAWNSLLFVTQYPDFEPFNLGRARREEPFARQEGEGMPHEDLFMPLGADLASHSFDLGRLEGEGTRREEGRMRLEEQGTRREGVSAGREVPFRWEGGGGKRLAGLEAASCPWLLGPWPREAMALSETPRGRRPRG